ncbi:unnamed protein product, partial [Prorocentrum cordatum]
MAAAGAPAAGAASAATAAAPGRSALGDRAQTTLGAAAELVAMLESPTLAAGSGESRTREWKIQSALEGSCRTLDGVAAFLRHPRGAEAVVASQRRLLEDGAVPKAGLQEDDEEVLGSDGKNEEAGPKHRVELGAQVETVELEPREAQGKLKQKSALRELLGEQVPELQAARKEHKQRIADTCREKKQLVQQLNHQGLEHHESKAGIKQVKHEAQDLANMVDEQRMKYAQLEKATGEQHKIASLAGVPAFPVLHIVGQTQSCNVEQQQRDDDAQETNGQPLSSAEGQGSQRNADEAKVSILNGQVSSTDEYTQVGLGSLQSIVKNQGSSQHAYAKEKSNGDALS